MDTPTSPAGVALTPAGGHLYVANFNGGGPGTVSAFRVAPDGTLRWLATTPTGAGSFFPAFTPDGRLLVVANSGSNDVSVLRVRPGVRLAPVDRVAIGGDGPRGVVVPTGLPAPTGGAQPDFGGLVLS